jgi:hypothetical protein
LKYKTSLASKIHWLREWGKIVFPHGKIIFKILCGVRFVIFLMQSKIITLALDLKILML